MWWWQQLQLPTWSWCQLRSQLCLSTCRKGYRLKKNIALINHEHTCAQWVRMSIIAIEILTHHHTRKSKPCLPHL